MAWQRDLNKTEKEHVRENCVPLEGLHNKNLVTKRVMESADRGCSQCRAILHKLNHTNPNS